MKIINNDQTSIIKMDDMVYDHILKYIGESDFDGIWWRDRYPSEFNAAIRTHNIRQGLQLILDEIDRMEGLENYNNVVSPNE